MFRGREITYTSFGRKLLDRMAEDMLPLATIERDPRLKGKNMFMILAPRATPTGPPKFTVPTKERTSAEDPNARGTAKRVKVTSTGKVMHRHQFDGCGHILSKKTRKRKRNFRKDQPTFKGDLKRLAPTIPYLV